MMSPAEFAAKLQRAAARIKTELPNPTAAIMSQVAETAKEAVGTYTFGWPQLAEFTQESRVALGFSPNDPLLRTGSLQASINFMAMPTAAGAEGLVYSGETTALWAEMGTSRGEPPRSFLFGALWRSVPVIAKEYGVFMEYIFLE